MQTNSRISLALFSCKHAPHAIACGVLLLFAATPLAAQDQSVRPGINDSFKNPDVGSYVERFEAEGREIYELRAEIVKAVGLKPGMAVADVGAGTGLFTRMFATEVSESGKIYAVDIAENFLKHINESCAAAGIKNVTTVLCDQDDAKLPEASVDLIFVCDTYHHFEFPTKTLASLHKALRPGGQLVVIDFRRVEGQSSDFIMQHVRAGQDVFAKEISDAGFKQVAENKDLLKDNYFLRFERVETGKPAEVKQSVQVDRD